MILKFRVAINFESSRHLKHTENLQIVFVSIEFQFVLMNIAGVNERKILMDDQAIGRISLNKKLKTTFEIFFMLMVN